MSESISFATPAMAGRQKWILIGGGLGVLTLHRGRLGFQARGHQELFFDADIATITVAPKGRRAEPTKFGVDVTDGTRWVFAFWDRNTRYHPIYAPTNFVDVPIEAVDLTDRWQAEDTCAAWLRILADPTAPDPKAWHPD